MAGVVGMSGSSHVTENLQKSAESEWVCGLERKNRGRREIARISSNVSRIVQKCHFQTELHEHTGSPGAMFS